VSETLRTAISAFGASAKAKLSNPGISGQPEDQLRRPLETLIHWFKQGCEICRQGVLSGSSSSPALVGTSIANHAHLRRCHACGSWWEENEREAHVISEADVLGTFKDLF